jgi:hypothetical protein
MNKPWWESPLCWLCDYGAFVAVLFLILAFGAYRFLFASELSAPIVAPTSTPVVAVATPTPTRVASFTEIPRPPTLTATSTPVVEKPEFILVFVPVNWKLSQSKFEQAAQKQADIFMRESDIENYFTVKVVPLEKGLDNVSLGSDTLVYDILEFVLQEQPGDRYIGLTDGDLNPDGESDVVGWTSGGSGLVAEYQDEYVVTHELGHTFGLCDEYSYADWKRQDEEKKRQDEENDGCPNLYPEDCPQEESNELCKGAPAKDGSNSIMGPAGMSGAYSFNEASLDHLKETFQNLAKEGSR